MFGLHHTHAQITIVPRFSLPGGNVLNMHKRFFHYPNSKEEAVNAARLHLQPLSP